MKPIFTILCIAGALACAPQKTVKNETQATQESAADYLIISQGGGFTGAYETYLVKHNGKILELQSDSTYVGQLDPGTVKFMFDELASLGITNGALCPAGNMNYSITAFLNGTKTTLTWADDTAPKESISAFYSWSLLEIKKAQH